MRVPTSPIATPESPFARTSTVSLVLVQASTHSSLNVSSTAVAQPGLEVHVVDRHVRRDDREHRGHRGASIAAPFAIPPTTAAVPATEVTASLRTVSVVRIASAAASAPLEEAASFGMPETCKASIGMK